MQADPIKPTLKALGTKRSKVAVQVDPIKPTLKALGTKRSKVAVQVAPIKPTLKALGTRRLKVAVQVAPIRPTLKAPGPRRLNLNYDELLSNFAFKSNLRRYNKAPWFLDAFPAGTTPAIQVGADTRPLFGST